MTALLRPYFASVRQAARHLWRAWLAELRGLLPARLRTYLAGTPPPRVPWPLPPSVASGAPVVLRLGADQVMAQRLSLPLAATRELNRVLTYELDRYLPYPAAQVHFVAHVVQAHAEHAQVLLVAVAREHWSRMLADCAAQGLTLQAVEVLAQDGRLLPVDLLPAGNARRPGTAGRAAVWLTWLAIALGATSAGLTLHRHQALVDSLQGLVDEQRQGVAEVQRLRGALATSEGAAAVLDPLKTARPSTARVLADLTHCLGDENWLEQFEIADGQVTFSGQSPRASALLARLKSCTSLEGAQFQGVIQADATTGNDRFAVAAQLKQEAEDAPRPD